MSTRPKPRAKSARSQQPQDESPVQLAVRFDAKVVARLEALAERLSRPGLALSRTDALRVALMTGLESIEREPSR